MEKFKEADLLSCLGYFPGTISHAEEWRAPLGYTEDELEHVRPSQGVLVRRQGDMVRKNLPDNNDNEESAG